MKEKNKLLNRLNVLKLINSKYFATLLGMYSFIILCLNGHLESYNIISIILLIILIAFFQKYCKFENKNYFGLIILASIFSFLLILGKFSFQYMDSKTISIISQIFTINSLLLFLGYFFIIYSVLNMIVPKICEKNSIKRNNTIKINYKIVFLICFILIFCSLLPYFLSLFPGTLSNDSIGELISAMNNNIRTDHHTIAHMLFIRLSYLISSAVFHSPTAAVAIYSIMQMIILSLIFSYSITFLYKRKINIKILIILLLFYMIIPIFGYYSIVMWKDVLYGAFALFLTIGCFKLYEERNNISIKTCIMFIFSSLLAIFFRNNAIYMYFILVIFSFIFLKNNYKKLIIIFIIVLGTYFTIKGPIFKYFSVNKSISTEYIAIPMQQIGRMAYKDIVFTKNEQNSINKIIDINIMKNVYNPKTFDDIKFNPNYKSDSFDNNKFKYFKLWLSLIIKYPTIALEAYSISTLGYWYPNIEDRAYENSIVENSINLKITPKSSQFIQNYVSKMVDLKLPLISNTWSIGTYLWILLVSIYIAYKKNGIKFLYTYIPVLATWLTIMIATPVYNETRYIFGIFTSIPFLVGILFIDNKKIEQKKYRIKEKIYE